MKRLILAGVAVAFVAVSCAFGSPAATPFPTQTPLPPLDPNVSHVELDIKNFQHKAVEIEAGTVITWTNMDRSPHTVTHFADQGTPELFDSNRIEPEKTYRVTFDTVGVIKYYCKLHPVNMRESITIVEKSGS